VNKAEGFLRASTAAVDVPGALVSTHAKNNGLVKLPQCIQRAVMNSSWDR
jgi:hypothetical protein